MMLVPQRTDCDCSIAAIATWTGHAYEDVYVACARVDRVTRGRRGLCTEDVIQTAAKLGVRLTRRNRPDLDTHEGILNVIWHQPRRRMHGHFVVLWQGLIIDLDPSPAGIILEDADDYLVREGGKPGQLLVQVR